MVCRFNRQMVVISVVLHVSLLLISSALALNARRGVRIASALLLESLLVFVSVIVIYFGRVSIPVTIQVLLIYVNPVCYLSLSAYAFKEIFLVKFTQVETLKNDRREQLLWLLKNDINKYKKRDFLEQRDLEQQLQVLKCKKKKQRVEVGCWFGLVVVMLCLLHGYSTSRAFCIFLSTLRLLLRHPIQLLFSSVYYIARSPVFIVRVLCVFVRYIANIFNRLVPLYCVVITWPVVVLLTTAYWQPEARKKATAFILQQLGLA